MKKIKNFQEFIETVNSSPELQEKLKANPVDFLKEYSISPPAYTNDKLVYRIVVFGFVGSLFLGLLYFIFQYQNSLEVRTQYSKDILSMINAIPNSDSLDVNSIAAKKLDNLKTIMSTSGNLAATTPDGIIPVFTAIIGVLAGLFAPSPFSNRTNQE